MERIAPQRRRPPRGAWPAASLALLLLAGCQGADQVTKAGPQEAPIRLRIGTGDLPGLPAADQIEQFAREVAARSEGRLLIEPDWNAVGDDIDDDWDQKVARKVVSGDLDLGLISARAWDTEGVTSLRALNAPMLVTSDELVEQVISGELATTMLAGLEPIGITGLALLPEGIRRVFWLDDPKPSVADFSGAFLRVPASATTYATFEALGARADDATADRRAFMSGEVDGVEVSFLLAAKVVMGGDTSTVVGNLPLWPKANSLVANQGVLSGLPEDLQAVLREAAAATRAWAVDALPSDAEAAKAFCEGGGRVVVVDESEVESFRSATAGVIEELERDATTRELIAAIEALKSESSAAEGVPACAPAETAP